MKGLPGLLIAALAVGIFFAFSGLGKTGTGRGPVNGNGNGPPAFVPRLIGPAPVVQPFIPKVFGPIDFISDLFGGGGIG